MAAQYSPPGEHVIINTSTGSLAILVGTCISLAELKSRIATSTGCDPLAQRLFNEAGRYELVDDDEQGPLIPSGAILQLFGGPILQQVTRRRDRRGHVSAEPLPLTAMFACGFIGSIPEARQRLERFQRFAESRDLPLGALISAVGAVCRAAKRSVAHRSCAVPRLQVQLPAPKNILVAGSNASLPKSS